MYMFDLALACIVCELQRNKNRNNVMKSSEEQLGSFGLSRSPDRLGL